MCNIWWKIVWEGCGWNRIWLFTSGKKRAFGAFIYLHRYNEDTLARIRTDYVLELQVKIDGEIARTQQQLETASSTVAKKTATKMQLKEDGDRVK